jgi:hypothetical protein
MGRSVRRGNKSHRTVRGDTVEQAQLARRARAKPSRKACIDYVRERDRHHCRLCGRFVQYDVEPLVNYGEVHEFIFRSRGGSDVEPTNCVLVCKGCHTASEPCIHPGAFHTTKRVIVALDVNLLMEGPIRSDIVSLVDGDAPVDEESAA